MPRGLRIGRLFGTDIEATPGFGVLLAVYLYIYRDSGTAAIWCLAVVVSLLVHEFGHVLAVRRLLREPCRVLLWGLGGLCVWEGRPGTPGRRLAISLAGPAAGFAAGLLVLGADRLWAPAHPFARELVSDLLWINIAWSALNLLPIWPLDGGQALYCVVALVRGRPNGDLVRRVSLATTAVALGAALYVRMPFAAVLAGLLLMENLRTRPGLE